MLDAAIGLLTERGLQGTTMSAVIERSGVARATVYLRWPHRQELVAEAVRRALGSEVARATGDAEQDLRAGAARFQRALQSAAFRNVLPALVAALSTPEDDPSRVSYDTIAPGRIDLAADFERVAAAQGFRTDVPGRLVIDAMLGAYLGAFLGTGVPPSDALRDQVLDVLLNGLRTR